MSIPILQSCNKRNKTSKLFEFHTFGDSGCPVTPTSPFLDNIRLFLGQCGELEDYSVKGMTICPDVITVDTTVSPLLFLFLNLLSWSSHIVSERQYHVIILHDNDWNNKHLKDDDIQKQNHFLHGLIHRNGFGHLLCINGIEGGSKKITVEDVSKKKSMDLRLLNGVAYRHPWFGRLESVVEVIVNVLLEKTTKKVGRGGMSQMEVREAARKQIGDTGLLDYVLKSMNNVIVGDHIVRRVVNPSTGYYNTQFMSLVMVKNLKPLSLELMLAVKLCFCTGMCF
ncbi:hypothetical protein Patl1_34654 [Pistacia atlantica]|uniref:Uncharacterized protein n=1 Tax=Pistacia atlantica TaxID=434234 RepID=A0ACC0ZTQ7_9ROSI|nr:hypothetical protein Patl1_34654 [Pistacia atlantica]